jgi:hypothetical protein
MQLTQTPLQHYQIGAESQVFDTGADVLLANLDDELTRAIGRRGANPLSY